jgi:hypothetical protein
VGDPRRPVSRLSTLRAIALAVLEVLVHLDKVEVPADYVVMAIRFDRTMLSRKIVRPLVAIAADDFRAAFYRSAGFVVPSVIVARESNLHSSSRGAGFRCADHLD